MIKYINKLVLILAIAAIILSACAVQAPVNPVITAAPPSSMPSIADIMAIREWKPLQEGPLVCASNDNGGGKLQYTWTAEKGTLKGEGQKVSWTAPDSPGQYSIYVEVTNDKGEKASFSKTFKVTTNPYNNDTPDTTIYLRLSLPSSTVISEKSHPKIWTASDIQCEVSGVEPSDLTYKWTAMTGKLAGDGLNEGKASRVGWIAPGVGGTYKVSVVVTDKSGNTASGEVNFDVYCCKP